MGGNQHHVDSVLVATLIQLIVIVLVARGANIVARKMGQPGAVGEILAGLALGPSLLGTAWPDLSSAIFVPATALPIQILSQLGLIFLMFQIGADFHFGHLARTENRRVTLAVAAASISGPVLLGLGLGWWTAPILAPGIDPLVYALFLAVALAITAVPILGRILKEFGMTHTPIGVIAISAAAINDVVGWLLLGAVSALATAGFSGAETGLRIGGVAAFACLLFFLGRPLADRLIARHRLEQGQLPASLMAIVVALMFAAGICTYELGIFAIFGGFALGLLFHAHRAFVEAWQRQVGQFVLVFFLPIFFTYTGLRTNVLGLVTASDWAWCALIVGVAVLGKIGPVYAAGRLAGLDREDALVCGTLMNTRALMELIVLNIGLDLGFIPPKVFTMLVIMAVASTIMTAPLLRLLYRRAGRPLMAAIEA